MGLSGGVGIFNPEKKEYSMVNIVVESLSPWRCFDSESRKLMLECGEYYS